MRYQFAAALIALVTVLALTAGAVVVWPTVAADGDDRRQAAAEAEFAAFEAALRSRVAGLQAHAVALLQDQRVVDFAARGASSASGATVPPSLQQGRVSRGGADYLLLSGPGRSVVYEDGLDGSIVNGAGDTSEEAVALLDGAAGGGVFDFTEGPVVAAGAGTGPGTDRAAVTLGVLLDGPALEAMAGDASSRITLAWTAGPAPDGIEVRAGAAPGRSTVLGTIDLAQGRRALVAAIDMPGEALPARAGQADQPVTRWLMVLVGLGAVGAAALAGVVRTMANGVGGVRSALLSAQENDGNPAALDALASRDEVGRTAEQAATTLRGVRERTLAAIEDARVATARQLLGEHVIRSMHEGVLVERADGACIVCNPASTELLDIEASSVLGVRDALRGVLGDALYERLRERARNPDAAQRLDVVQIAGRDLAFDAYLVPGYRGEGDHLLVIVRDVSAVLEVEQLKRDIVSVVSHELRTPLTVITLSLGMLDEPEADRAQLLAATDRNVERMRLLVDDLLDLGRLESGQATPQLEPHDPAALCHEAVELLAPQAREKQITVREAVDGPVPATIEVDRRQFQRAVTNLVSNAIKFSQAGTDVWVILRSAGDDLYIDVADSGPGVPAEERERIFTRFYRASNTREHVSGTGLGLPIVRQIAELHGGAAALLPTDRGAYFRITLPVRR